MRRGSDMRRDLKVLILVLTLPLILYSIGYAYATVTTSTYVVVVHGTVPAGGQLILEAFANAGDFVTGGGYVASGVTVIQSNPMGWTVGPPPTPPTSWLVNFYNEGASAQSVTACAVCMTPVTVAGIGVPEFASLYMAIALAACVYFALNRIRKPSLK